MSNILVIDKNKDPDLYDDYANQLLNENADKYLCLSEIKYDFLSDSLNDSDYLLVHIFTYNDIHKRSEIRGFASINFIQDDLLNKHLYLKILCNSKFHSMDTRLTNNQTKLKGKDMMDKIKELGEKLRVKYIQLDSLGTVIPYYYNLGFRFENNENREYMEELLITQLRNAQLQNDEANTDRIINEIVSKYYPGYYSEKKQREFGEGDGTRHDQAMEYGIPMIYTFPQPMAGGSKSNRRTKRVKHIRKHRANNKTRFVPIKYIPLHLSQTDKNKQREMLKKSAESYKKGKYYTRKKVNSFVSKKSPHVLKAMRVYKIDNVIPGRQLSQKTGCSLKALNDIVKKGEGAYFSSGSRPNQTAQSWGRARLASAVTGGKSAVVDYYILNAGCSKNSKALQLANQARRKYGTTIRNTRKIPLK